MKNHRPSRRIRSEVAYTVTVTISEVAYTVTVTISEVAYTVHSNN